MWDYFSDPKGRGDQQNVAFHLFTTALQTSNFYQYTATTPRVPNWRVY